VTLSFFGVTRFDSTSANLVKKLPVDVLGLGDIHFDDGHDAISFFRSILGRESEVYDFFLASNHNHASTVMPLLREDLTVPSLVVHLNELTYGPLLDNLPDIDGVKILTIYVPFFPTTEAIELHTCRNVAAQH